MCYVEVHTWPLWSAKEFTLKRILPVGTVSAHNKLNFYKCQLEPSVYVCETDYMSAGHVVS